MQITGINHFNSNVGFRGILSHGKVNLIDETHYDHGMEEYTGTMRRINERKYYPYWDESAKEIEAAVAKNTSKKTSVDGLVKYIDEDIVKVMEKLPFAKNECEKFMREHSVNKEEFIKMLDFFKLVLKNISHFK